MPLEDREKKLLVLLVALASRVENDMLRIGRAAVAPIYLLLRQLVLKLSNTGIFRQYEWARLRQQARQILMRFSDSVSGELLSRLNLLESDVRKAAADYVNRSTLAQRPPRTMADTAATTTVLGSNLAQQFDRRGSGNLFVERHLQDLDKTVQAGLIEERTTAEIADTVIGVTTVRGAEKPVFTTGSAARRAAARLRNFTAAAVWSVINRESADVWQGAGPREWIWIAVLDPATCPVCRPLNNQVRATPAGFGISPPAHPNCRCVILPRGFT